MDGELHNPGSCLHDPHGPDFPFPPTEFFEDLHRLVLRYFDVASMVYSRSKAAKRALFLVSIQPASSALCLLLAQQLQDLSRPSGTFIEARRETLSPTPFDSRPAT
jgi:hypothetical protein